MLLSLKHRFCDFLKQSSPGATGGQTTSQRSSYLPKLILYRKSDAAKALGLALAGYDKQVFFVSDSFLKGEGVSAEVARLGWTVRDPLEARANDSEKTIFKVDRLKTFIVGISNDNLYNECQGIEVESLMIDQSFDFYPGAIPMAAFNIKTVLLRAVSHITVLFDTTFKPYDHYDADPFKSLKEWMQGYCQIEDLRTQ
jgi:hypothetical protein